MSSHTVVPALQSSVLCARHARRENRGGGGVGGGSGGVSRGSRVGGGGGRRAAVSTAALPPANEIAGFIIGGGLVGLVFAASKLDGIIAKAQVKGFEEDRNQTWRVQKPTKGDGNIFIVPEDEK